MRTANRTTSPHGAKNWSKLDGDSGMIQRHVLSVPNTRWAAGKASRKLCELAALALMPMKLAGGSLRC